MLNLTRYPDANAFLAAAGEVLYASEALHSLMIGIVERLTGDLNYYGEGQPYLAVVSDQEGPLLAGTMTPPFGLVLAALREDAARGIPLLVGDLVGSDWGLPNAQGETRFARLFAQEWAAQTGGTYHKEMDMRLYVLHQVTHPENVPGEMLLGTIDDLETITRWLHGFETEALNEDRSEEHLRKVVEGQIGRRGWYLWWDEGEPVSMCILTRPTRTGVSVSGVYTPRELRGRGYASACVAALSQHLLDEGYAFTSLFTDLANPTSNSIYMQIGYQPLADFDKYKLVIGDQASGE